MRIFTTVQAARKYYIGIMGSNSGFYYALIELENGNFGI